MSDTVAPAALPRPTLERRRRRTGNFAVAGLWSSVGIGALGAGYSTVRPAGIWVMLAGILGILGSMALMAILVERGPRPRHRTSRSSVALYNAYRFLQEGDTATYLTAATRASLTSAYLAAHAVEADAIAADRCEAKGKPVGSEGRAAQSLARRVSDLHQAAQQTRGATIAQARAESQQAVSRVVAGGGQTYAKAYRKAAPEVDPFARRDAAEAGTLAATGLGVYLPGEDDPQRLLDEIGDVLADPAVRAGLPASTIAALSDARAAALRALPAAIHAAGAPRRAGSRRRGRARFTWRGVPLGLGRPRRDPDSTQAPAGQELQADTGADALATIRDAHTTALRVRAAAERSGRLTPEERAGLQR